MPTRLAFGLEEIWQNELTDQPLNGPTTFKVIARYYGGDECLGLIFNPAPPACPTHRDPAYGNTTTHPDQQDGIWIPDGTGGVTLAVGNDGGFYRNHVGAAPGALERRLGQRRPDAASARCFPTTPRWPTTAPSTPACRTTAS